MSNKIKKSETASNKSNNKELDQEEINEMSSKDETSSDYLNCIEKLNHLSVKITNDSEKYIFISYIEPETKLLELFIVTSGSIFNKELSEEEFIEFKNGLGFDGSIKNFILSLLKAIERKEDGDIKITKDNKKYIVTFIHPLAKDVKVSSKIEFSHEIKDTSKKYINVAKELLFSLQECKDKQKNEIETNNYDKVKTSNINKENISEFQHKKLKILNKNEESEDNKSDISNKPTSFSLRQNNLKRKYNGNLINPNIKKRKNKKIEYSSNNNENDDSKDK